MQSSIKIYDPDIVIKSSISILKNVKYKGMSSHDYSEQVVTSNLIFNHPGYLVGYQKQ